MGFDKDRLHNERRKIEADLKGTIFSKDKMDQRDCRDKDHEEKRVQDYVKWKNTRGTDGRTNAQKMERWGDINREFKQHGEEGRIHNPDQLRVKQSVKYD